MGDRSSRSSSPTDDNKRLRLDNASITAGTSAENRHKLSLTSEARDAKVTDSTYRTVQELDALLAKVFSSSSGTIYEGTGVLEIQGRDRPLPPSRDRNSPTQLRNDLGQQTSDLEALIKDAQVIDKDYGFPDKDFQKLKDKIALAQNTIQENNGKKSTIALIEKYYHLIDTKEVKDIIQPVASGIRQHIDKLKQIHEELTTMYEQSMMGEFEDSDEDVSSNSPRDKSKSVVTDDSTMNDAPNVYDTTDSLHTALYKPEDFKRSLLNNEVKKLSETLEPAMQALDMGLPFGDALPRFTELQGLVEKANQILLKKEDHLDAIDMIQDNSGLIDNVKPNTWLHTCIQTVQQYLLELDSTHLEILQTTELLTKDITEHIPLDVIPLFSANWENNQGIRTIVEPLHQTFDEDAVIHRREIAKKHYGKEEITDEEMKQFDDLLDQKSKDMINGTDIWHATEEKELIEILKCGRFKSQFETGKSRGTYDISSRSLIEQGLFGYGSDTKEKRPIYGYLSKNREGNNPKVGGYGRFRLCLKREHIQDRTTVIMHDTLCLRPEWNSLCAKPVLYTNPNKDTFPIIKAVKTDQGTYDFPSDDNNPLDYKSVDNMNNDLGSFAEVQVHGGVTKLSIGRIVAEGVTSKDLSSELRELLEENNIPISYV